MTTDEVNRAMSVLADLQKKIPGTIGTVKGITFISPEDYVDEEGNIIPNETTMGEAHGLFGTKIYINLGGIRKHEGSKEFKDRYSFCNTLEDVIYHEYGHAIDNQNKIDYVNSHFIDEERTLEDIWDEISLERDANTKKARCGSRFFKSNFIKRNRGAVVTAKKITPYAAVKNEELFAEAFTWVMNPTHASQDKKIDDNRKLMRTYLNGYRESLIAGYEHYEHVMKIADSK